MSDNSKQKGRPSCLYFLLNMHTVPMVDAFIKHCQSQILMLVYVELIQSQSEVTKQKQKWWLKT